MLEQLQGHLQSIVANDGLWIVLRQSGLLFGLFAILYSLYAVIVKPYSSSFGVKRDLAKVDQDIDLLSSVYAREKAKNMTKDATYTLESLSDQHNPLGMEAELYAHPEASPLAIPPEISVVDPPEEDPHVAPEVRA